MPNRPKVVEFAQPDAEDPLAQTAAEWVVSMDRGLNPAEAKALADWLAADARHAAEFARITMGWRSLDAIAGVPDLASMADAVVAQSRARRDRRRGRLLASGFLAAAALAAAFILWRGSLSGPVPSAMQAAENSYVVLTSTAHRMALPDGSVAELNGDSRIETDFTPAERRVSLIRGEAHFFVSKNPSRPFIVSAGPVTVRAVGTAFDVRLEPGIVEVLVTEGKVRVADVPLSDSRQSLSGDRADGESFVRAVVASERAVVRTTAGADASVAVDRPTPAALDEALAWQSTRLVFDHTPLYQVVNAFNRYNSRQLAIADPVLRDRTLTGIFRTDNLAGFTRLLRASVDVVAEPDGENRTLLRAAP